MEGWRGDRGSDGRYQEEREEEEEEKEGEKMGSDSRRPGGWREIRLNHLLSIDLKNRHHWIPNPRVRACVRAPGGWHRLCLVACCKTAPSVRGHKRVIFFISTLAHCDDVTAAADIEYQRQKKIRLHAMYFCFTLAPCVEMCEVADIPKTAETRSISSIFLL